MLTFNDPATCDFAFVAEGKEVLVHRQVIVSQSAFFREFLQGDPTCTRINANNALFDAMNAVMASLYQLGQLNQLEDESNPRHSFAVLLSAWEISTHFQLSRQCSIILPLVLRRVDRSNVVRAMKAALKQLQASSSRQRGVDEGAMKLRDVCLEHLPPLITSEQQEAEWQDLLTKHRWLSQANSSAAKKTTLPASPAATTFPAASAQLPLARGNNYPQPAALVEQVNEAVRSARSAIEELRALRSANGVNSVNSSYSVGELPLDHQQHAAPSSSSAIAKLNPSLVEVNWRSSTFTDDPPPPPSAVAEPAAIHEEAELHHWLEQWNNLVAAAAESRQRRASEEAALRQRLEHAFTDDVDLVELQEKLDLTQQQILEIQQQSARQRNEVDLLEKEIAEGQQYTASTQVYIPAAQAAKEELLERIASTKAWLAAQPLQSPQTPVVLRRSLAAFATELRDKKSQAQRETSIEENKIASLTRQVASQIETISSLGQMLNDLH